MDPEIVERLITMFERSALGEMHYSDGAGSLRLVRGTGVVPRLVQPPITDPAAALHTMRAGATGTFYRRAAPDQTPLVETGDLVTPGQPLGLLEAMKMMLPVEADCAGRVQQILQPDGAAVQTGMPLFVIDPGGAA